ncbi:Succinate--CoA ligase [ADP-forming] subunit beta OS=Streptomyces alboniger OX=132473 GN=sucC PE=3 SV=1 [Streptomyces alboniger]
MNVLVTLWKTFIAEDALLVEVNPLAKVASGDVIALDGKVTLDDNAGFRQGALGRRRHGARRPAGGGRRREGPQLRQARREVGIIGNGAGWSCRPWTWSRAAAPGPANFLDIGGGASARIMADGLSVILSDPAVKSVFVNVFGGITACDAVADGIVQALRTACG